MSEATARELCETSGITWHEAVDPMALANDITTVVSTALQQEIEANGVASLVVSGGSTPAPVFERLSTIPLDWSRVCVTLADERWVPPGHADSNESLVRDTLLVDKASAAQFVPLYREGMTPEGAVAVVASDLLAMAQPFTLTLLGMGGDGHTASLFPDAPAEELGRAMALDNVDVVSIMHPPSVEQVRITLTRAALLNSRHRIVHMTGISKKQVLASALSQGKPGGHGAGEYVDGLLPIVGLLTSEPQIASVYWSE